MSDDIYREVLNTRRERAIKDKQRKSAKGDIESFIVWLEHLDMDIYQKRPQNDGSMDFYSLSECRKDSVIEEFLDHYLNMGPAEKEKSALQEIINGFVEPDDGTSEHLAGWLHSNGVRVVKDD